MVPPSGTAAAYRRDKLGRDHGVAVGRCNFGGLGVHPRHDVFNRGAETTAGTARVQPDPDREDEQRRKRRELAHAQVDQSAFVGFSILPNIVRWYSHSM